MFIFNYIVEVDELHKEENIGAAILFSALALPFWLAVSGMVFILRRAMNKRLYWFLNSPTIAIGAGYIIMNVYIFLAANSGN